MIPTPAIRRVAQEMLTELDAGCLHVVKVPGQRGGYVRVAIQQNADWYRRFCQAFARPRRRPYRRPRTIIKRCHTRRGLLHLAAGKNSSLYSARLMDWIMHHGRHEIW